MITIRYEENNDFSKINFYNLEDAIKFAYHLWKNSIEYKYIYGGIELIEHNSWDFIELEKCIEAQIELIDKLNKGA